MVDRVVLEAQKLERSGRLPAFTLLLPEGPLPLAGMVRLSERFMVVRHLIIRLAEVLLGQCDENRCVGGCGCGGGGRGIQLSPCRMRLSLLPTRIGASPLTP